MTEIEKLKRDIETLTESLKIDEQELRQATKEERDGILRHGEWCATELDILIEKLREGTERNR